MVTGEDMMGMLVELMPQTGLSPEEIDLKVKSFLGENGLDVDAVFMIGNAIMNMAVQADEPPEQTVVGAFVTGTALAIMMHNKGVLS